MKRALDFILIELEGLKQRRDDLFPATFDTQKVTLNYEFYFVKSEKDNIFYS